MQPFDVSPHLNSFINPYPSAEDVARASIAGGRLVRLALARLWLSEGVPFAFRARPAVYESVRSWLGARLGVDPKEITLVGSARVGESLSPSKLGRPFSPDSDLDLTIVSSDFFKRVVVEFNRWAYDYEGGAVRPANDRERKFWDDHLQRGPDLIYRGFLDSKMIPLREPYALARQMGQTVYLLCHKLALTHGAPAVHRADIRIYQDWGSFARQVGTNLAMVRPSLAQNTVRPSHEVQPSLPPPAEHRN
jgi:hypothetical protein